MAGEESQCSMSTPSFVNSGLMLARRGRLEGRKVCVLQTMGSLGCFVPSFHSRTSLDQPQPRPSARAPYSTGRARAEREEGRKRE